MMPSEITLINVFEVVPGYEEAFVLWWKEHTDVLRSQPGFLDARLHSSISENARFRFVNVAHWQTSESLAAARAKLGTAHPAPAGVKGYPEMYQVELCY